MLDAASPSRPLEPAHKVPILHHRYWAESAEGLVDRAANEYPGIAVIEPEQPDPRAEPSEPSAEGCVAVEDEAEISADDVCIRRERFVDPLERSGRQPAVGMKEEQHIAARRFGANSDPGAATGGRDKGSHSAIVRNLERPVLAAAIHDDDLVGGPLLTNRVEQIRKRTFFV